MIRIVTAARLRRRREAIEQAHTRAREVQEQADAALSRHLKQVWELTARAERAERSASMADWGKELAEAAAKVLREELEAAQQAGRTLFLLLHYGEPHSIHGSREDAYAYADTQGTPVHRWVTGVHRPAAELPWVLIPFTQDEAVKGFRSVMVRSPEPMGGAA
ncbi:hypothetical protein [Streptomyces sp. NPDC001020]